METKKPPLGVEPKYVWQYKRAKALKEAMERRVEAVFPICEDWIDEYNELVEKLNNSEIKIYI